MKINAQLYTWQIILNPNALLYQCSQFWNDIENKLKEVKINYFHHETSTNDEAKELMINLCKKGERHFIIIGGDGSLNLFVNAVMKSQVDSTEIFAAQIPLGTGNDWCRTLGYSRNYLDAIDLIVKGNYTSHDVGLVETVINDEVVDTRYFVNIAGFGFDGAVIFNASKKKSSKTFNKQLYLINTLKTLIGYKSQPVRLQINDGTAAKNIFSLVAGIGQYNGNGMRQCPEAIPNDGLFDVVMIEKVSVLKVLLNIKHLYSGAHVKKLKEASMERTNYLEITANPYLFGEVEGEVLSTGNYRVKCLASAINFIKN